MRTFNELNRKRQQFVICLMKLFPAIKETGTITLAELKAMPGLCDDNGITIPAHPVWVYGEKEFRTGTRGVYAVPLPEKGDVVKNSKTLFTPARECVIIESKDSSVLTVEEFEAECAAAGIV